jgi:hypothetical protein
MNLVSDLDLPAFDYTAPRPEFFGGPLAEHIDTNLNHGPAPDVS